MLDMQSTTPKRDGLAAVEHGSNIPDVHMGLLTAVVTKDRQLQPARSVMPGGQTHVRACRRLPSCVIVCSTSATSSILGARRTLSRKRGDRSKVCDVHEDPPQLHSSRVFWPGLGLCPTTHVLSRDSHSLHCTSAMPVLMPALSSTRFRSSHGPRSPEQKPRKSCAVVGRLRRTAIEPLNTPTYRRDCAAVLKIRALPTLRYRPFDH